MVGERLARPRAWRGYACERSPTGRWVALRVSAQAPYDDRLERLPQGWARAMVADRLACERERSMKGHTCVVGFVGT
jgi:hypothetical protein